MIWSYNKSKEIITTEKFRHLFRNAKFEKETPEILTYSMISLFMFVNLMSHVLNFLIFLTIIFHYNLGVRNSLTIEGSFNFIQAIMFMPAEKVLIFKYHVNKCSISIGY